MHAIAKAVRAEIEIKRSRFICLLAPVTSEEQARAIIAAERDRYPDARHHCSAFIIERAGENSLNRSNDDGEPSGTAGAPMLQVLSGAQVTNIVAVVTRYFGGIKLGTGGLVRAYSDAVKTALEGAELLSEQEFDCGLISTDAASAARALDLMQVLGVETQVTWADPVQLQIQVAPQQRQQLEASLATHFRGTVNIAWIGRRKTFA